MGRTKLIVAGIAAVVCVGAASSAATRRVTAIERALALRAKYDPFAMKRQPIAAARPPATSTPAPVPAATRPAAPVATQPAARPTPQAAAAAPATVRVAGTAVRPPYRPATRSPYQPPVRGPYISSSRR